jgi:hypothetical protein
LLNLVIIYISIACDYGMKILAALVIDSLEMPLPPEVLFHRYFQELGPFDRKKYRGKHDLERLEPPELRPLLVAIQGALNEGLTRRTRFAYPLTVVRFISIISTPPFRMLLPSATTITRSSVSLSR